MKRIVVVCPNPNDELLAAANFLGIDEIARRLAVRKPSPRWLTARNRFRVSKKSLALAISFVTAAKQFVSSDCAIDLPAGPTEAIVLAEMRQRTLDRRRSSCASRARSRRRQVFSSPLSQARGQSLSLKSQSNFARAAKAQSRAPFDAAAPARFLLAPSLPPLAISSIASRRNILALPARRAIDCSNKFVAAGTIFRRSLGRATSRRLRERQQSRSAHSRLGSSSRRPQRRRFCEMHHRAENFSAKVSRARQMMCSFLHRPKALQAHSNAMRIRR